MAAWKSYQIFSHEPNIFLCQWCNGKAHTNKSISPPPKTYLSPWECGPHVIHPSLSWSHTQLQTTSQLVHAISHNYATISTKSPLITMGCPTFILKTALFPLTLNSNLIHPSLDRPHSKPQTASRSNQLFVHNSHTGQTEWSTDRIG